MTPEILTRKTNGAARAIPVMPKPKNSRPKESQPEKPQPFEQPTNDWREAAMFEVLHHFEEDERTGALLGLIRRYQPAHNAMVVAFDRERLQEFFKAHSHSCRSLLEGQSWRGGHWDTFDHWPYLSWHAVNWNGGEFEVALPPSSNSFDDAIVVAIGTQPLHSFVQELISWCERPSGRALRYSHGWDSAPDLDEQLGQVTWDDVVLAPSILQSLREAVEGFFTHREAYRKMGFAWRRGVLLIGPPGTGKTMICKAVAGATPDLPFLYVRDLRERNQKDAIRDIFNRARKLAPCVLAFEDVDGFICDANRTAFLNEMDGFHSNDGLLVIASSNHPGKIDEALLKRPSRFDRVFHIGLPDEAERAEYARRLMSRSSLTTHIAESLDREQLAVEVAAKSKGFTPAYIKEAFTAAALQRAQSGAMVLDAEFAAAVLAQVAELKAHLKRLKNPDVLAEMSNGEDVIGFRR